MPNPRWRFTWRRRWEDVWSADFVAEWAKFVAADPAADVHQQLALIRVWAESQGAALGAEPAMGIAQDDRGHRILLPLIVLHERGSRIARRTLELVGTELFGVGNFLIDGALAEIDLQQFWAALRIEVASFCDMVRLRQLDARWVAGTPFSDHADNHWAIPLDGVADLEAVLARCTHLHRRDVRRSLKRCVQRGPVEFWVAGPNDAAIALQSFRQEFSPHYHALWDLKSNNLLRSPGVTSLFEEVLSIGIPQGWAHYSVLRVGGVPIAWHIGLNGRDQIYCWIWTYDASWKEISPGKVLVAKLIEFAISTQRRAVQLFSGDQPYKGWWKPSADPHFSLTWFSPNLRGRALSAYDQLHRRFYQRIRARFVAR